MSLPILLRDVEHVIEIYESETGTSAIRTRQMIERIGVVEALSRLACSADLKLGFRVLRDRDQLQNTFEAMIVKHSELFSSDVVSAAEWRLEHANEL